MKRFINILRNLLCRQNKMLNKYIASNLPTNTCLSITIHICCRRVPLQNRRYRYVSNIGEKSKCAGYRPQNSRLENIRSKFQPIFFHFFLLFFLFLSLFFLFFNFTSATTWHSRVIDSVGSLRSKSADTFILTQEPPVICVPVITFAWLAADHAWNSLCWNKYVNLHIFLPRLYI